MTKQNFYKYYIKLYHEILRDPKMGKLSDHLWRKAVELMLIAGMYDQEGYLPSEEDIAWVLRENLEIIKEDLKALSKEGVEIVVKDNGRWLVRKFADRQSPMEPAEYNRRRRKENEKPWW